MTNAMKTICVAAVTVLLVPVALMAAKAKLVSGDLAVLKGQTTINVEFDYAGMTVGGKATPETQWLAGEVAKRNGKKAGSGDAFQATWVSSRAELYAPRFLEELNKELEKAGAKAALGAGAAKYTLIVRTVQVEPGATIGFNTQAWATLDVRLVDTATKDVALATIGIEKIRPATKKVGGIKLGGYDAESRLAECYDDGGEALGELLVKLGLKAAL
jgi:hypothetical protein